MDKKNWKPKRLADDIMRPADMKKQKLQRPIAQTSAAASTSGVSSVSTAKPKLDFRPTTSSTSSTAKSLLSFGSTSQVASNAQLISARPSMDDKWNEYAEAVTVDVATFNTTLQEAISQQKFNKVAKLLTGSLNLFISTKSEKFLGEYRVLGSLLSTVKKYGAKLHQPPLHRGLLHILCMSRPFSPAVQDFFIATLTSLVEQQTVVLDKYYLVAFLYDAIGVGSASLGGQQKSTWIEKKSARRLVSNILAATCTVFPTAEMYSDCQIEFSMAESFPDMSLAKEPSSMQSEVYMEFLRPWFDNVKGENPPRALLRCLGWLSGFAEVRSLIASRLDIWLQNPKYQRDALELLLFVGCNIDAVNPQDVDTIDVLLKLRNLKNRNAMSTFSVAMRAAAKRDSNNVYAIFSSLVNNEVGPMQNRSATNLAIMNGLLGNVTLEATKALATVCAKLLISHEDFARTVRAFLRELIRNYVHTKSGDFPFAVFAAGFLMEVRSQSEKNEHGIPEYVPMKAIEMLSQFPLIVLANLMSLRGEIFPSRISRPNQADIALPIESRIIRDNFMTEFRRFTDVCLNWLGSARQMFMESQEHIRCYHLLLYTEKKRESYTNVEFAVVNEQELLNCIRIFTECGITENTMWMLLGTTYCALPGSEAIEIIWQLTQRAALTHKNFSEPLFALKEPVQLIDRMFQVVAFIPQECQDLDNVVFLANAKSYWTIWNVVLLWAAGGGIMDNFYTVFSTYPTLRYYIHMIMTRKYEFPLPFEGKSEGELRMSDALLVERERQIIMGYESMCVTTDKFALLSTVILAPRDAVRRPPQLSEIRALADRHRLAAQLCRSKDPPLLDVLVQTVGAQAAMPAIKELLLVDSAAVEALSSNSLCHALLYYVSCIGKPDQGDPKVHDEIFQKLLSRTKQHLQSDTARDDDVVLRVLVATLASKDAQERNSTTYAFRLLFPEAFLSTSVGKAGQGFVEKLAALPRTKANWAFFLLAIADAVLVEFDVALAAQYVHFLSQSFEDESMHKVAREMAQVVAANRLALRDSLCEYFVNYLNSALNACKITTKDVLSLPSDICAVQLAGRILSVKLNRSTPAAVVRLLSAYPPDLRTNTDDNYFDMLVEVWLTPQTMPKLFGRTEEDLGPLKFLSLQMRKEMLRAKDPRVVDAALYEMTPADAEVFAFNPQMRVETAARVYELAKDMDVATLELSNLKRLYLIMKGYRLNGVTTADSLFERVSSRMRFLDSQLAPSVAKENTDVPMEAESEVVEEKFQIHASTEKMTTKEVTAWLKANATIAASKKQPPEKFSLPMELILGVIRSDATAVSCVTYIEANVKFLLAHPEVFQSILILVDTAASKYQSVRTKLESLAVRLLKSVSPPASIASVLKKYASSAGRRQNQSKVGLQPVMTVAQLASTIKKPMGKEKKKNMVLSFVKRYFADREEELLDTGELVILLNSLVEVTNSVQTAERCVSGRWPRAIRCEVCRQLLKTFQPAVNPHLVCHFVDEYCTSYQLIGFRELFQVKNVGGGAEKFTFNFNAIQVFATYCMNMMRAVKNTKVEFVRMATNMEKYVGVQFVLAFCQEAEAVVCSDQPGEIRKAAEEMKRIMKDEFPYIKYEKAALRGVRLCAPMETREACHRRCESLVDKFLELEQQTSHLEEDECEDDVEVEMDSEKKGDSRKRTTKDKFGSNSRGFKRSKWQKGGDGGSAADEVEEDITTDENLATLSQLRSMLRDHPSVVKTKFPVIASFVSTATAMNRKELKSKQRVRKVEFVMTTIQALSPEMGDEELGAVEIALSDCLEFYETHIEEGVVHVREQLQFCDELVAACIGFIRRNATDARELFRENRPIMERLCKRARDRLDADLIMEHLAA